MKNSIIRGILALSFLVGGGIVAVQAQIESDAVFTVNVPFSFNVRGKSFPAGKYAIRTPEDSTNESVMEISPMKGKKPIAIFDVEPISVNTAPNESNVIFGQVQGKYYLSEIWEANNPSGNQVEEPDMKQLERSGIKKEKQVVRAELSRRHVAAISKRKY
jgi:hypothetical protein